MKLSIIIISFFLTTVNLIAQFPLDSVSTFRIQLSPESCTEDPAYQNVYKESIDKKKGIRKIETNGIPSHQTGKFPNAGNPNAIAPVKAHYEVPLNPEIADEITMGMGMSFGVLFSGVELDPYTNEFFQGPNGPNREWNITTLTSTVNLGLDCNNGHVQPNGKYHYHGTPNAYLEELNFDGSSMIKLGYAADGFPIYYKFGYNEEGKIIELISGYSLRDGERTGDGVSSPNGVYDGTYFNDYEYVEGLSELDQCNGRWGKTPENENEYYYVITDNFPSSPLCFRGTPSDDFRIGGNINDQGMGQMPPGGRPDPEQIMERMDSNGDKKLSKDEVRGPLVQHFDQLDNNHDGFLTIEELKNAGPPQGPPRGR